MNDEKQNEMVIVEEEPKGKTSERHSKRQVSPIEETKGKKKSSIDSESVLKKPKLKILSLVNSPKYGKPMRNYIPQRQWRITKENKTKDA